MVPSEQAQLKEGEKSLRMLPLVVGAALLLTCCGGEEQRFVANAGPDTPTMATTDVSTLISDSGYTRYHLTAPVWLMYEDAEDPYWLFPDGLELEQYDLHMNPESTVTCDSARYFSRQRVWRLDGHVVMVNTQADSFLTQQLFWDQTSRKLHSDSFIHIVRTDRTIEGYGFESDQSMTAYTVHNPTAILPASDFARRDTASSRSGAEKTDSTPVRASTRKPAREPKADPTHIQARSETEKLVAPSEPMKLKKTN